MWIHMFEGILNLLTVEEKETIYNDIRDVVKRDSLTTKNAEMLLVAVLNCLQNSDIRCNDAPPVKTLDFMLSINIVNIRESAKLQMLCSTILENSLCKGTIYENADKYVALLNKIYQLMNQPKAFYCFNQNYANYNAETVQAISLQQDGNPSAALAMYEKAKSRLKFQEYNHEFCREQSKRCMQEQIVWNSNENCLSTSAAFILLKNFWPKLKVEIFLSKRWNTWDCSYSVKEFFTKLCSSYMVKEKQNFPFTRRDLNTMQLKCVSMWNALPKTFISSDHYTLLQLIQQISEFNDALTVINELKENSEDSAVEDFVNTFIVSCTSKKYSLSDDPYFTIELLNHRTLVYNELLLFCKKHFSGLSELCNRITFERKKTLIDLHFVGIIHGKHLKFLKSRDFSTGDLSCLKSDLSTLLFHANKFHLNIKKEYILSASQYIFKCKKWINSAGSSEGSEKKNIARECQKLLELLSEDCKKGEEEISVMYLKKLFQACTTGNNLVKIKFITKILWFLQCDGAANLVSEYLFSHYLEIPPEYWLPFLPILILYYCQCKSSDAALMKSLMAVIINVEKHYPEEVLFSFWNYKNGSTLENNREKIKRFEDIWKGFQDRHSNLVAYFEKIIEDLKNLKSNPEENYYHKLCLLLQKATPYMSGTRKEYSSSLESRILNECISMSKQILKPEDFNIKLNNKNTLEAFKNELSKMQKQYAISCRKYIQSRPIFLQEFCKFIQHWQTLDYKMKIFPFYQSLETKTPTIYKFESKVDILEWHNSFAYRLNIVGSDGKIYSYLLMENDSPEETLKSDNLMCFINILNQILSENVQCSQSFLKYLVPRTLLITSNLKLVSYMDTCSPLYETCKVSSNYTRPVSIEEYESMIQRNYYREYLDNRNRFYNLRYTPKDIPICDMNIYLENFIMKKKQFLQSVSLLLAAEFLLNLTTCKKVMLHKDSGMVIPEMFKMFDPMFKDPVHKCPTVLMTPEIESFIGNLGLNIVVENMMEVLRALQENYRLVAPLVYLFYKTTGFKMFVNREQEETLNWIYVFIRRRRGLEKYDLYNILKKKIVLAS